MTAPTLLIVGGRDESVLELNRRARRRMDCETALTIVPGATHLFEEPGTLAAAAEAARDWFVRHLALTQARWRNAKLGSPGMRTPAARRSSVDGMGRQVECRRRFWRRDFRP